MVKCGTTPLETGSMITQKSVSWGWRLCVGTDLFSSYFLASLQCRLHAMNAFSPAAILPQALDRWSWCKLCLPMSSRRRWCYSAVYPQRRYHSMRMSLSRVAICISNKKKNCTCMPLCCELQINKLRTRSAWDGRIEGLKTSALQVSRNRFQHHVPREFENLLKPEYMRKL